MSTLHLLLSTGSTPGFNPGKLSRNDWKIIVDWDVKNQTKQNKTVCKGYQQMTKVATSKERVNDWLTKPICQLYYKFKSSDMQANADPVEAQYACSFCSKNADHSAVIVAWGNLPLITQLSQGSYSQVCVKFKGFSRTSKRLSYCFWGQKSYENIDLPIKILLGKMLDCIF